MRLASLRLRLLLAAAIATSLAVGLTGVVLVYLFQQYVENRVYSGLESHLQQLTEGLSVDGNGAVSVTALSDQRFSQPFSGLFWQVVVDGDQPVLSRSLWDEGIALDTSGNLPGKMVRRVVNAASGGELLVIDWTITIGPEGDEKTANLAVAADRAETAQATSAFAWDLTKWLALLIVALLLATSLQVGVGLRPLEVLRGRVARIRAGDEPRLGGDYPVEVQPLVEEVNTLLEVRDKSLGTARARAGDLAHGLKTPLTVLAAIARQMRQAGDDARAAEIDDQIALMRRHVERELMRARLGMRKASRVRVRVRVQRMVNAMKKLPRGSDLSWHVGVPDTVEAPMEEQDLSELLGNLLDNSRIWAAGTVQVSAGRSDNGFRLSVDDDGPGVPEDKFGVVLERGQRLDEGKKGSGLGLAIARDIAVAYGGTLTLSRSPLGGLQATLEITDDKARCA
jgi:signal transduction histidine kinase